VAGVLEGAYESDGLLWGGADIALVVFVPVEQLLLVELLDLDCLWVEAFLFELLFVNLLLLFSVFLEQPTHHLHFVLIYMVGFDKHDPVT
jgi:hypothetical protein